MYQAPRYSDLNHVFPDNPSTSLLPVQVHVYRWFNENTLCSTTWYYAFMFHAMCYCGIKIFGIEDRKEKIRYKQEQSSRWAPNRLVRWSKSQHGSHCWAWTHARSDTGLFPDPVWSSKRYLWYNITHVYNRDLPLAWDRLSVCFREPAFWRACPRLTSHLRLFCLRVWSLRIIVLISLFSWYQ